MLSCWLTDEPRLIWTCWQMSTKPEAVMLSAISCQHCQGCGGTAHFASECNKEINPAGRDLKGLRNEDQKLQKATPQTRQWEGLTMVWVQEAFTSIFKYWSPGNHLTQSLLKFSTNKFPVLFPPHTDHDPKCTPSEPPCCSSRLWQDFHHPASDPKNQIVLQCAQESLSSYQSNEKGTWLWGWDHIHPILMWVLSTTDWSGT